MTPHARPRPPKIVVGLRGEGRTHALITWLCHGTRIGGHPGWSRMLVVNDAHIAVTLPQRFRDLDQHLRALNTGGLARLVVTADQLDRPRGLDPAVEFAVDDAEHVLGHPALRWARIAVLALTGYAVTPAELNAPDGILTSPEPLSPETLDAVRARYGPVTVPDEATREHQPGPVERTNAANERALSDWLIETHPRPDGTDG